MYIMQSTTITAKVSTILKKFPEQSRFIPSSQLLQVPQGKKYKVEEIGAVLTRGHLQVRLAYGAGEWWIFPAHWDIPRKQELISAGQLQTVYPHTPSVLIAEAVTHLNYHFPQYEITSNRRIAMFLAQIGHESGGLRWREEFASGAAYQGRRDLGNLAPGSGVRYKGRGWIQLTGYYNYVSASRHTGVDLVNKPELASTVGLSAQLACWFWHSRGLNGLADKGDMDAFKAITKRINGGFNGLQDRIGYWERAKKVFPG